MHPRYFLVDDMGALDRNLSGSGFDLSSQHFEIYYNRVERVLYFVCEVVREPTQNVVTIGAGIEVRPHFWFLDLNGMGRGCCRFHAIHGQYNHMRINWPAPPPRPDSSISPETAWRNHLRKRDGNR